MVGTAAGANLKGLEEKHSLGMWRRQIGRILEKKRFVDGETESKGLFYLVQRLAGSLPDYV